MDATLQPATIPIEPQQATPPCLHFGACGGCQLQDFSYAAQLERKATHLRELLRAAKLATNNLPQLELHASTPFAYRNRIRLTLREIGGLLRAGYLGAARSKADAEDAVIPSEAVLEESGEVEGSPHFDRSAIAFVPITQCPIAAPILWRAAEAFTALANQAASLRTPALTPDQLELFTTADESQLQLTLFLRTATKREPARLTADFTALCESLRTHVPELAGAGIAFLPPITGSRRSEQPRPGPAWGSPGLNYTVRQLASAIAQEPRTPNLEPLTYWVPRGAFFQANRFLLPELVSLVSRADAAASGNSTAWDLYAGVGLFSRALHSRGFSHVTAVEIAEPSVTALAQTKLLNLRAVKATTLGFLRSAVLQRDRPSLIVLDPPRTGLGDEVCSLLARIAAPTLVYVSCSPQALARDLAILTTSGYAIGKLHLFDLFPQTTHIETVAILTRC